MNTESERRMYTVVAARDGRFWFLRVPEIAGVFSQVVRLDQADRMAREAISLMLEVSEDSFDLDIRADVDPELTQLLDEAKARRAQLVAATEAAAEATAAAIDASQRRGLTVRDTGRLLGVSHQRVAQLAKR